VLYREEVGILPVGTDRFVHRLESRVRPSRIQLERRLLLLCCGAPSLRILLQRLSVRLRCARGLGLVRSEVLLQHIHGRGGLRLVGI